MPPLLLRSLARPAAARRPALSLCVPSLFPCRGGGFGARAGVLSKGLTVQPFARAAAMSPPPPADATGSPPGDATSGPARRLATVRAAIAEAARAAGRDPAAVTLVAVSKTFDAEHILPVLEAGQRVFGENRVQEAKAKWPDLRARFPDVELHLIGPLQSNKAREAVELFDVIHTVDRPRIAEALAKEMVRTGRRPRLLVEVNTGEEAQKAGVLPAEVADFVRACRETHGLAIAGLMCIPPVDEPAAVHFAFLAKLAREVGVAELSMGMSADYREAIHHGATSVRVGSAIFGQRG
jgi:pyridoxal phosphate enzyme (YggS family)